MVVLLVETNNQENYTAPSFDKDSFHCPLCNTYAHQKWHELKTSNGGYIRDLYISFCFKCEDYAIWHCEKMIYPKSSNAPLPHKDMPKDVRELYNQARNIAMDSPIAAAALLRTSIEKLMKSLEVHGKNLNERINNSKLPPEIIDCLNAVRVCGNSGIHEGKFHFQDDDNETIVQDLFSLVNFIVKTLITEPQRRKEICAQVLQKTSKSESDTPKS